MRLTSASRPIPERPCRRRSAFVQGLWVLLGILPLTGALVSGLDAIATPGGQSGFHYALTRRRRVNDLVSGAPHLKLAAPGSGGTLKYVSRACEPKPLRSRQLRGTFV